MTKQSKVKQSKATQTKAAQTSASQPKPAPSKTAQSKKNATKAPASNANMYILIGVAVVGVLALGYLLFTALQGDEGIEGVAQYPGISQGHDNTMVYTGSLPPAGGAHFDVWQTCGVYDEEVNPGYGLHSMEHGAVWITYDPAIITAEQLAAIAEQVRDENYLLLSPFPDQSSPLVLTAWGSQLELDSTDDPRVAQFIERYRLGPNTPERGASCVDGNGEPL